MPGSSTGVESLRRRLCLLPVPGEDPRWTAPARRDNLPDLVKSRDSIPGRIKMVQPSLRSSCPRLLALQFVS